MADLKLKPKNINAAVLRIGEPKSTCLLFRNGKVVVSGTTSKADALVAMQKFAEKVSAAGHACNLTQFKVVNMVGAFSMDGSVNLTAIYNAWRFTYLCILEPEIFPGLRITFEKGISITIFHSGKFNIAGPKTAGKLRRVYKKAHKMFKDFIKV